VVTSVVSGREGRLIGGRLECLFLNGFYARWMYFAAIIGWPFVVGKLMVFRRSTMARIGGLSTLSRYIAEDYMAGVAIRRLGMKIAVMNEPIEQYIGPLTLQKFWSRHIRWGRIRKAQSPLTFLIEPLLSPFFGLGSGLVAIATLFSVSPAIFFSAHLVIWLLCDMAVYIRMEHKMGWTFFFDWLIREPVSLGIWMQSLLGSRINWRGNDLKILPGGLVTPR
ncbi:MAG: glycosyltransferase, partial [Deltaproteobacteria bacterium]|nr:glycosyltransferase [Deltaproteobacteria bacterium]